MLNCHGDSVKLHTPQIPWKRVPTSQDRTTAITEANRPNSKRHRSDEHHSSLQINSETLSFHIPLVSPS
jgi:hypothetical protein